MDLQNFDESTLRYPVPIDVAMYDASGAFFPSAYLKIITAVVQEHLAVIEMDVPRLVQKYNVSWVLLSLSVELRRPLTPGDELFVRTWDSGQRVPLYRRDLAVYSAADPEGEPVAVAATFSTVMDLVTRHICSDRAILDSFQIPAGPKLLKASSRFASKAQFRPVENRTARPSWQDGLGHVNNVRYGEIVYDALSTAERAALKDLKRMDIWFLAELRPGQSFAVEKALEDDGALLVRGTLLLEQKPSFVMKLTF